MALEDRRCDDHAAAPVRYEIAPVVALRISQRRRRDLESSAPSAFVRMKTMSS